MTDGQADALEALKKVAQDSLDSGLSKSEIVDAIQKLDPSVTEESERSLEIPRSYVDERLGLEVANEIASSILLVQHDTQERSVDLKAAVVLDETQLAEFVHKEIDARARGADHLCQRLLRHFGKYSVSLVFFAVTGKQ
jgi:hypothetical protein